MTQRDKSFVVILFTAVVGIGVVSFFVYSWFLVPLKTYNASIEALEGDLSQLEEEQRAFAKGKVRLEAAKLRSLPVQPYQATAEYLPFLETLLREAGLAVERVAPGTAARVKSPASVPEIKEVDHRIIAFSVSKAIGDEAALVSALERLRTSPYEYRVHDLKVKRVDGSYEASAGKQLEISMTVEVLLVAGSKNEMGKLAASATAPKDHQGPGQPSADGKPRVYADIAGRNIFVGPLPIYKSDERIKTQADKDAAAAAAATAANAPPEFVPRFVYLTTVSRSLQEAHLFNRIYGGREEKLIAKQGSGYEFFKITDENRDYIFFRAKILAIGDRDMYFQVRDQVYAQHIGKSMADAMKAPLSVEEMLDLDLYDYFDKDWAKEQTSDEKKKVETGKRNKVGKMR